MRRSIVRAAIILFAIHYSLYTGFCTSASNQLSSALHLSRAFEFAEKSPLTDEKVHLIVNLVSLRHKIQPDSTNLIASLEPALTHWIQHPPKPDPLQDYDPFTDIYELIGLYLTLGSLPHAERALSLHRDSPMRLYSISAIAHDTIVKKDLRAFNRFHQMLRRAAADAPEGPNTSVREFVQLAECLATNHYPKQAAGLFSEAKSLSSASRLTLAYRLDSLEFGEIAKSPIETLKKTRAQWREDWDQILSSRVFDLVQIGFAQHRSGFSNEALQTLKKATATFEDISVENRFDMFAIVFRLALGLNQLEYAEKMLKLADKDELSDNLFSLAEAEIWKGKVQKAVARIDQIPKEDLSDYRISSLAIALSESHRFELAEQLISRIEPDSLQEMIYPSLITNLCHAGRSSEAQRYLARISDSSHRTTLANLIPALGSKAPAPAPLLSEYGSFSCGTGALLAQEFRNAVLFAPQKALDRLNSGRLAHPRNRHTTIRSIGEALGSSSSTSSRNFWQTQFTDPLDLAFFHLGLAEGSHSSRLSPLN